jgi:hypothetical protein
MKFIHIFYGICFAFLATCAPMRAMEPERPPFSAAESEEPIIRIVPVPEHEEAIILIEQPDSKNLGRKKITKFLVPAGAALTAILLKHFSPESAFLAFNTYGISYKVLMRDMPLLGKLLVTGGLIGLAYLLDKVILPRLLGVSDVGCLPLAIASGYVLVNRVIKDAILDKKSKKDDGDDESDEEMGRKKAPKKKKKKQPDNNTDHSL